MGLYSGGLIIGRIGLGRTFVGAYCRGKGGGGSVYYGNFTVAANRDGKLVKET